MNIFPHSHHGLSGATGWCVAILGSIFINQSTIMKFQLIAIEYTGLQFTKGFFNPKPKMGWKLKLKISKFAVFAKHRNGNCPNDIEK